MLYLDPSYVRLGMEVLAEAVRNPAVHALVIANEAERKQALTAMLASAWGKRAARRRRSRRTKWPT